MMTPQLALTVLVALSGATNSVEAHGRLLKPEARVRPESQLATGSQFDFVGEIEGKDVFSDRNPQLQWGRTPQQNQQQFAETFTAAGYKTLRQFFQANDKLMKPRFPGKTDNVCGFTDMAATPSTLPADGVIEWGHTTGKWGFQDNHHGPCEMWCDDNLVLRNDNCRAAYGKELPARLKIEVAKCNGAKRLQFLWLAVHFAKWQYWVNCVPLVATTPTRIPTTPAPTNASTPTPSTAPSAVPCPSSSVPVATRLVLSVAPPAFATATPVSQPRPYPTTATPFTSGQQYAPLSNGPRQVPFGAATPGADANANVNVGGEAAMADATGGGPSSWLSPRGGPRGRNGA